MNNAPNFRDYFDINPDILQMNSGTLAIMPRAVKQAIRHYRDEWEKNPAQSLFDTWEKMWKTQIILASFFKAKPEDIILRHNVTVAMNDFLLGVELPKGGEILTSDLEYGAILNILKFRCNKEQRSLRQMHLPGTTEELKRCTPASLTEQIAREIKPETRMLMLSHITTGSGLILPIEQIAQVCKQKGVVLAIDGAHGAGAVPLDFSKSEFDFYGSNLHKWMMGPKGTAFAWVNPEIKERLHPTSAGWTTFETPKPFAKFAPHDRWAQQNMLSSSYDFSSFFAIENVIKFWKAVTPEAIFSRLESAGTLLVEEMRKHVGWECLSDLRSDLSGPLYAFELPPSLSKMDFDLMNKLRSDYNLQVAVTHIQNRWCLRLAPQVYNTDEEIVKSALILRDFERSL